MINHSMCLKIGIALFTLGFLTMNNGLDGFGVSKLKKPQKVDQCAVLLSLPCVQNRCAGFGMQTTSIYPGSGRSMDVGRLLIRSTYDSYDVILEFARIVPVL